LRKATICFVFSVHPHGYLGSHWTDFHEILYFESFLRKSAEKIQISLKSDTNKGTLHDYLCTFMIIFRSIHLRIINVSDKISQDIKEHIFYTLNIFRKPCCLLDNVENCGRARQAIGDNMTLALCLLDNQDC
jgi:hypothetical protein